MHFLLGSDSLSSRFSRSEFGGVHGQGIMVVSDWLLVPHPQSFLGPPNHAMNSPNELVNFLRIQSYTHGELAAIYPTCKLL